MKKTIRFLSTVCMIALLAAPFIMPAHAYDITEDSLTRWVAGLEYQGNVIFNEDDTITIMGNSGIVTYTGAKLPLNTTVTVRFKSAIVSDDGWGAIYICNDLDEEKLRDPDEGGGVRAFPWYGKGNVLSINIKNNRISFTNWFYDGLRPVNTMTEHGKYRFDDGTVEHTLIITTTLIDENTVKFDVNVDGGDTLPYTQYATDEEPMKTPGYISFACYDANEWLQILSVEIEDGIVEPSTEPDPTEPPATEPPATNPPETKPSETNPPATEPKDSADTETLDMTWIWIVIGAAVAAGVVAAVVVIKKKQA